MNVMNNMNVETHGRASLQTQPQPQTQSQSQTQSLHRLPKSISSFVGGFKSSVNSKINDFIEQYQLPIPKYNRNNHFF